MVVVGNKKVLSTAKLGGTTMVINTAEILPGDFTRNADFSLPTERLKRAIRTAAGAEKTNFVDATRLATALLGNSIGANIFMVGYAYQLGALPLSAESIERAIELNGEAVPMNLAAFQFGRRAAFDLASVEALIKPAPEAASDARRLSQSLRRDRGAARRRSSPIIRTPIMRRATRRWSSRCRRPKPRRRRARAGSPTRSRATCSS